MLRKGAKVLSLSFWQQEPREVLRSSSGCWSQLGPAKESLHPLVTSEVSEGVLGRDGTPVVTITPGCILPSIPSALGSVCPSDFRISQRL